MEDRSYMSILILRFDIEGEGTDRQILQDLVDSPQFDYSFLSPFPDKVTQESAGTHARWRLNCIAADSFQKCRPERASEVIRAWAEDQAWMASRPPKPPEVKQRLRDTYALLHTGHLYELQNPGPECEHEVAWIVGSGGFHEFVSIDRSRREVTLIAAYDD